MWWVVIPAAVYAGAALVFLAGATRAAFTVRDHVIGFGNLRYVIHLMTIIILVGIVLFYWAYNMAI